MDHNFKGVEADTLQMMQARAFNEGLRMLIALHTQRNGAPADVLCSTLAHSIGTLSALLEPEDEDSFDNVILANIQIGRVTQRTHNLRSVPSAGSA